MQGTNKQRRFVHLRKQLDQMGYKQALDETSQSLVEKMLKDLLRASEVV